MPGRSQNNRFKRTVTQVKYWLSSVLIVLLLTGCVTVASDNAVVVRIECPALVKYDKEIQTRLADEIDSLPPGSPLRQLINDYSKLRDMCRKIKGSK